MIPNNVSNLLRQINGFYFSTKYPGDSAQTLSKGDISICYDAVEACKKAVDYVLANASDKTKEALLRELNRRPKPEFSELLSDLDDNKLVSVLQGK